MSIHILGTGITGGLECMWGDDAIVRTVHFGLQQVPASDVEVVANGDPEIEAIERTMVAEAQARIARKARS